MANAAHTLTLAEQHGARSLKVVALRFVAANAVEVMKTDGSKHMAASRHALLSEVSVLVRPVVLDQLGWPGALFVRWFT